MPKIKNPNHVSPAVAIVNNRKAGIAAYLTNNAALAEISFDKIRADFPALADELTDGMLHEICKNLGIAVLHD